MMEFKHRKKAPEINVNTDGTNQLIIGIRPCDVHGIMAFDPTFDSDFSDPYFKSTRNNTLLIGLACNDMDINCFCRSLSSGPFDETGMDIMMVDIGSEYLFYILTENGKNVVEIAGELFQTSSDEQIEVGNSLKVKAEEKKTRQVDTQGKPEIMGNMFEDDYWAEVAKRCLGCGICTYLCPTCYCFDITDEKWGKSGRRMRTWDSCMYPEYTVHASDYNPRPARLNRLRNRFYHKFKYYPDLYNKFGCTGCGRCVRQCPVNIDIIDVINGINTANQSSDITTSTNSYEKATNSGGEH
jgi:ferredoxin